MSREAAMAKHTETPWEYGPEFGVITKDGGLVADAAINSLETAEQRANAEFIVRACNAHDDLVAAAEAIIRARANTRQRIDTHLEFAINGLRAAIAKVGAK